NVSQLIRLINQINERNVYQLSLVLPVIKMLDAFMSRKHNLSSDEFCMVLFMREKIDEKNCKSYSKSLKYLIDDVKEIQVPPESLHYEIAELFMTIVRFEFPLRIACEAFVKQRLFYKGNHDLSEIMVITYVLIFQVSSLAIKNTMDFFVHFKIDRILNLLSYLLRKETLDLFYTKSCDVFEESFVQEKIYEPYLLALPRLKALRIYLREEKQRMMAIPKQETTKPIFMKVLNHVKRATKCPPPTPEVILNLTMRKSPRKIPNSIYFSSSIEERLNILREANKDQALRLLREANKNAPACSRKREIKLIDVEQEIEKRDGCPKKRLPIFKPVEIKQNATSILRECARIANEELKEVSKIQKLVEGYLDPESIEKLNEERKQRERQEEINKIEEKHLIALLTREGAYLAKRSFLNENKTYAQNVREEKKELYHRLEKLRTEQKKEASENVEKCRELEQASRDAYDSMIDEKRQKAAEVSEKSRQLKMLLAKQKEEEIRRKGQLIKEIKAIQSLRLATRNKEFDPTETSGLGLLCEMSLAELKERLVWVKMKLNEELEKRQIVIQRERERQKNIVKYSKIALDEYKSTKKSDTYKRVNGKASNVTSVSPQVLKLQKKLEERRALRTKI
ncbi:eukaryotic translation initiation factor 5B-like, partial [Vespa mandarinia]|uniref:eukaryotic translation initiation factor 5B-like n=1 Tax=Vespa mandarinia TaxID=7446 RepID=UPI0016171DB5